MKYGTFCYTREYFEDYSWHRKADILPASFYKFMPRFIRLREMLKDHEIDWAVTLFFMKPANDINVVCRVIENGQDSVGRVIYSLEGLVSRKNGKRNVLGMGDVVKYFYENPEPFCFLEVTERCPDEVIIDDTINPLLPYEMIEGMKERLNCKSFQDLIKAIRLGEEDYSCVIGPQASTIFPYIKGLENGTDMIFKRCYEFNSDEDAVKEMDTTWCHSLPVIECDRVYRQEKGEMTLYLRMLKERSGGSSYQWYMLKENGEIYSKSEKHRFKELMRMTELVNEGKWLENFYSLIGYKVR